MGCALLFIPRRTLNKVEFSAKKKFFFSLEEKNSCFFVFFLMEKLIFVYGEGSCLSRGCIRAAGTVSAVFELHFCVETKHSSFSCAPTDLRFPVRCWQHSGKSVCYHCKIFNGVVSLKKKQKTTINESFMDIFMPCFSLQVLLLVVKRKKIGSQE